MMGTVESHEKIAEALGIGLAELYTGIDRRYEQIEHLPKSVTKFRKMRAPQNPARRRTVAKRKSGRAYASTTKLS